MCAPYMLQLGRISKTAFCEISHFTTFAEYLTFSRLRRIEQLQSYLYTNGINNSYFLQNLKIYQYIYIKKKNLFDLKSISETSCFFLLLEKVKTKDLSDKSMLWIKVT